MNYTLTSESLEHSIDATVQGNTVRLSNGEEYTFETNTHEQGVLYLVRNNAESGQERLPLVVIKDGSSAVRLSLNGYTYHIDALSERDKFFHQLLQDTKTKSSGSMKVVAPMPGLLKAINVKTGQRVKKGERLFILEAMKMENDIKAPMEGIVGVIGAEAGVAVEKSHLLCMIDAVPQEG
jgi:biotin carboxyl carrier protein